MIRLSRTQEHSLWPQAARRLLDAAALHGVHHGLQAVVRAEFLVDAVQMIPRHGPSDTQFAGDLERVFGPREYT
jgi:hypothetical protein